MIRSLPDPGRPLRPKSDSLLQYFYGVSNRVDAPKDRFMSAYFDLENE